MKRMLTTVAVLTALGLAAPALGAEGTAPAPEKKVEATTKAPAKAKKVGKSTKKPVKKVAGRKAAKAKTAAPRY